MRIFQKAKENLFVLAVVSAYLVLFALKPRMGIESLQNNMNYIREMIMIMPVIFVLTALLDTWVPKEQIMRFLGKEAGIKGIVFSLVLGSVSAGPIYAAFPLCVMLHQKGASIRNLVIILSAWAVIKIPMLLNELKFLGFQFMAVRWVLTVAAIVIFSWITARLVRDQDLPDTRRDKDPRQGAATVRKSACIGCGLCAHTCPEGFAMENRKAVTIRSNNAPDREKLFQAAQACPANAITLAESLRQE